MDKSIGADSTGPTGNFAPILTQEPGQTLRFAPVPFMAVLWFVKWTLLLYLLNLTKGAKFAGSVGHPMTKMLSASGGFCPQTPIIGSCSALATVPPDHWPFPPPMSPTELCSGTSNQKSAPMDRKIIFIVGLPPCTLGSQKWGGQFALYPLYPRVPKVGGQCPPHPRLRRPCIQAECSRHCVLKKTHGSRLPLS